MVGGPTMPQRERALPQEAPPQRPDGGGPLNIPQLLRELTVREKVALCSGQDFWHLQALPDRGIPPVMVADGPHGLRKQKSHDDMTLTGNVPATCFPTASALASTWNRELLHEVGAALGREARAEGVSVLLGPGVNIKRSPLGGRNFEYFSEDPFLTGALATAYIRGVQSTGVGTSLKHFAVNNQETRRYSVDAIVDERALREIYLAGFEKAVTEAQPWTVMAAYNRVNGTYCSEHKQLLTDILRGEWGFAGAVISDWGAVSDRAAGLAAGLDVEMPGSGGAHDADVLAALADGRLSPAALDAAVTRVLTLINRALANRPAAGGTYDRDAHHALARRAAAEGTVLLKNDGNVLPLRPGQTVAVIGAFAKHPRYQGAGSSIITPNRLDNAYDALAARVGASHIRYAPGYDPVSGETSAALLAEAVAAAAGADAVLVFAGLTARSETEGLDRQHLALPPGHNAVIAAVAAAHPRVAVILSNGAPVEMPWHEDVPAIVEAYLGGQAGGSAIADIVCGDVSPSGKLAETFPQRLSDHPAHTCFPGGPQTVEYRESIYVGYRYFDTAGQDVLFPFGHGLSYTTFAYSGLELSATEIRAGEPLQVTVAVTNTGDRAGQEVVQLYVHERQPAVFRPVHELKEFAKVSVQPGETQHVTFTLGERAFAHYDPARGGWHVTPGEYEIRVGASSRDIRAAAAVRVSARAAASAAHAAAPAPPPQPSPYWRPASGDGFTPEAFAAIYGRPLPDNSAPRCGEFTLNTPIGDMQSSAVARLLLRTGRKQAEAVIKDDPDSPTAGLMEDIIKGAPLRLLLMVARGQVSLPLLRALLLLCNGKYGQGLAALLRAALGRRPRRPAAK